MSEDETTFSSIITPPSHILTDGTFVHLPAPTTFDRAKFFERSIADNRLITNQKQNDANNDDDDDDDGDAKFDTSIKAEGEISLSSSKKTNEKKKSDKNDSTATSSTATDGQPKIHPLAIASARLQAMGMCELTKAINLSNLVSTGEYFDLANIVNRANEVLEIPPEVAKAAAPAATTSETIIDGGTGAGAGGTTAPAAASTGAGIEKTPPVAGGDTAPASAGGATETPSAIDGGAATAPSATAAAIPDKNKEDEATKEEAERRLRSSYVLKRKRNQNLRAAKILLRHRRRLENTLRSQTVIDRRYISLRKKWRMAAPEHGTRVVGPVRPVEVVAVDVEVYDRDRTGGGVAASGNRMGVGGVGGAPGGEQGSRRLGRLARMIPRYAIIELKESVEVPSLNGDRDEEAKGSVKKADGDDAMDVDDVSEKKAEPENVSLSSEEKKDGAATTDSTKNDSSSTLTRAEPYAVADPTLGKIDPDFSPDKVPMLTLILSIEKPCTGFVRSTTLSAPVAVEDYAHDNGAATATSPTLADDEMVINALQHSLFCASLFDSLRKEISASTSSSSSLGHHYNSTERSNTVWLSNERPKAFLPPPSLMSGGSSNATNVSGGGGGSGRHKGGSHRNENDNNNHGGELCVIHCHEGEVKVQLDSEYAVTIQLIEAATTNAQDESKSDNSPPDVKMEDATTAAMTNGSSGSQTPQQVETLCRALLLHAQSVYHEHCMSTRANALRRKAAEASSEKKNVGPKGHLKQMVMKEEQSPFILRQCVALGGKILLERKIRLALQRLTQWLDTISPPASYSSELPKLVVEWSPLSLFDAHSHFVLSVYGFCIDVTIRGGSGMTVIHCDDTTYRCVNFCSSDEFELFIKLEIRRRMREMMV